MSDTPQKKDSGFSYDPSLYKSDKVCINVPIVKTHTQTWHLNDFVNHSLEERIKKINTELIKGFSFIREHPGSVTFFGSARFSEDHPYYIKTRSLARKIVEDTGYAVITGGGPGIMEAGNRGAFEADGPGKSIGLNIELPHEQILNPYVDANVTFYYFFTRKIALTFSAEAYIYFPGGFGTLDEFFEIITLMQTNKISKAPIILFGTDFWGKLDVFIRETLLNEYQTIDAEDRNLYVITEDEQEICNIIKNAPMREE